MTEETLQRVTTALGQRVALLREQRRLTQHDLAAAMAWPQPAISRLERGKQSISLRQLVRLAEVLEVDLATLLCGEVTAPVHPVLRPDLAALVRQVAQLDPSLVPLVTQLVHQVRRLAREPKVIEQEQE